MQYKVLMNTVKGTRKLVPYNDSFYSETFDKLKKGKTEAYESLYIYSDKHYEQLQSTGSLSGITDVVTDKVVFDFDSKTNTDLALADARKLVHRLKADGFVDEEISCFFSSGKGYHVVVGLTDTITRNQFEAITESYAGDLSTFDTAVKDQQRVFRLPLSYNKNSNKYKIQIPVEDFLNEDVDVDQIMAYAANPDFDGEINILLKKPKATNKFKIRKLDKKTNKIETLEISDKPDLSRKRKELTEAKFVLEEGFFEDGERNEACMILAATYRYLGYHKEVAYNMLKATLRLRNIRLGRKEDYDRDELRKTIIDPVYSVLWQGGTFSEDTGLLKKTIERYKLKTIIQENVLVGVTSVSNIYEEFALNIDKNTIKLGIKELDDKIQITTSSLVAFLAAPGAGKTSIALSIMNYVSNNDCKSIFFSMDMAVPQVYQRLIQKHTGLKSDVIMKNYKEGNKKEIQRYTQILEKEYKNVKFSFRSGMTVPMMRESILTERDITGIMPKLIVIDYLECVKTEFTDSTASKAFVASALKDLANELGVCVFLLVQPRLSSGDPSGELTSYVQIKGSSVLSESPTQILSLSRPGFNPKDFSNDKYATINVLKNRMGELSSTDLHWNGLTGQIRSLTEDEKHDLAELRKNKAQESENSEPGFKRFGSNRNSGDLY